MRYSLAGGTAALLLARLAPPAVSLGVFYLALLHWEPGTWGLFHLLLSVQAVLQMAAGLGTDLLILQKGSTQPEELPRLLRATTSLLLRVGVGLGAAMVVLVALSTQAPQSLLAASLLAAAIPAASVSPSLEAVWVSTGFAHRLAPIVLLEQGTRLLASFAALAAGGGPALVALAFFISKWLGTALLFQRSRHLPGEVTRLSLRTVIRQASPFALFFALSALLSRMDSLTLAAFQPLADVGFYGAATRLVLFCTIASQAFGLAVYPYLAASRSRADRFRLITRASLTSLLVVSFVPAAFLHAFPATTLGWLQLGRYLPAAPLVAILALALPALFTNEILFRRLLAEERLKQAVVVLVAQITLGVPSFIAGATLRGAEGVALASTGVAWLGTLGYLWASHRDGLVLWAPWTFALFLGGTIATVVRTLVPSQPILALVFLAAYTLASIGYVARRWRAILNERQ